MFNSSYIAKKHFNFFYLHSFLRLLVFWLFCIQHHSPSNYNWHEDQEVVRQIVE